MLFSRSRAMTVTGTQSGSPHRQDLAYLCHSDLFLAASGCRSALNSPVFRRFIAWHRFCFKKFLATFSAFPATAMTNLSVPRQEFNLLGFTGGQPHAARVKDTVTDWKVQTPSGSSVKISTEAQALYEKARAAEVTPQRTAIAPTTAEPDSISVQSELSFDQFVERSIRMASDYWGNEPGEPIVISKFAEKAKNELQDLSARVRSKLANAGIALTPPVELAPDRAGTGVKVGPHPFREKIEALINEDPVWPMITVKPC